MSKAVYLNPEETAKLEPFEWDREGRAGSGISPFAVPQGVIIEGTDTGSVSRLSFIYDGGEALTGVDTLHLTACFAEPAVDIFVSRYSRKVLSVKITPPVDAMGLRRVGERLTSAAPHLLNTAQRFSYLMIARVLMELLAPSLGRIGPGSGPDLDR